MLYSINEKCGDVDISLSCDDTSPSCTKITMTLKKSNQMAQIVEQPKEILNLGKLTITGLACQMSSDRQPLIVMKSLMLYFRKIN